MFWLYILKNVKTGRYYSGSISNLNRRLKQHRQGYTRTSRLLKTYELAYSEEYNTPEEARYREKKLKSYKSSKYLDWLISKAN